MATDDVWYCLVHLWIVMQTMKIYKDTIACHCASASRACVVAIVIALQRFCLRFDLNHLS